MKYLLDTNVISEMQKSNCSENVKSFISSISWDEMYISVISTGEISYGIERLETGKKKHELAIWLYTKLPEWFDKRIVSLDTEVMLEWGTLRARAQRTMPVVDTMIAATAIVHHMFLVTRNVKDFMDIEGINLINPWEF